MRTIGFAGTAKNTGKTTTMLTALAACQQRGQRTALTSIGYDGEAADNITGLPKPRYHVPAGVWVATAEKCVKNADAVCRIHLRTEVQTVLGRILVVEVTQPGYLVLAGPNRKSDLQRVLAEFSALGMDWVLVDGALNRLVPMICADGLVLATGAALDERIEMIASHAGALNELLHLPSAAPQPYPALITLTGAGGETQTLPTGSLLNAQTAAQLQTALQAGAQRVIIPGACSPQLLTDLKTGPVEWIFGDPLKLIASGSPLVWQSLFAVWRSRGSRAACLQTLPLRLVTVNPFYPRYDLLSGQYSPTFVAAEALLQAVRAHFSRTPVINTRQPQETNTDLLALLAGAENPQEAQ